MTQTLAPALPLGMVLFPFDWGWYDCNRPATLAEMAACHSTCQCGATVKHGTVVGRRTGPDAAWSWGPVLCRTCDVALSKADGYRQDW